MANKKLHSRHPRRAHTLWANWTPRGNEEGSASYDACTDLAIQVLTEAGIWYEDNDDQGVEVTDQLQSAVVIALGRSEKLRTFLDGVVTGRVIDGNWPWNRPRKKIR